ncbi:hypothetical protein XELAEV_18028250mg [Xenopus laevis]|uniref:Uncharacterized protein n=1 Tax=Xenopus laevis TaxID=8355 RepID=A0A974CZ41_XENLA|nr:hypothetical protein XELAEV_18028250mg [Xenopus laevis]
MAECAFYLEKLQSACTVISNIITVVSGSSITSKIDDFLGYSTVLTLPAKGSIKHNGKKVNRKKKNSFMVSIVNIILCGSNSDLHDEHDLVRHESLGGNTKMSL